MPKVQVYTWANCPYCVRAKDLLSAKDIAFEEINLDDRDEELKALRARTGMRTIPQIFVGEHFVGGFSELAALDARGELDRMVGR